MMSCTDCFGGAPKNSELTVLINEPENSRPWCGCKVYPVFNDKDSLINAIALFVGAMAMFGLGGYFLKDMGSWVFFAGGTVLVLIVGLIIKLSLKPPYCKIEEDPEEPSRAPDSTINFV